MDQVLLEAEPASPPSEALPATPAPDAPVSHVRCVHCGASIWPAQVRFGSGRRRPWTPHLPMYCARPRCRVAELYARRRAAHLCCRCGHPSTTRVCHACQALGRPVVEDPRAIERDFQRARQDVRYRRHVSTADAWARRR